MPNLVAARAHARAARQTSRYLDILNQSLLIGAVVSILWMSSVLALHAAGPKVQAMVAGEGALITETQ